MTASLCPVPKIQFFDNNGDPLAGGKVYTYEPGTTTNKATYTDSTAGTSNANPVVLDSAGRAAIWLSGYYRIVLNDADDVLVWDIDNVSSMTYTAASESEWVGRELSLTYVSATQFKAAGDYTALFIAGRRIKATVAAGTIYGTVSASSYAGGLTTVTVVWESGSLDAGLSAIYTGVISSLQSLPVPGVTAKTDNYTLTGADINKTFTMNASAAKSFTVPAATAVPSGSGYKLINIGTGALTITGTVSGLVNPPIAQAKIISNGTSWYFDLDNAEMYIPSLAAAVASKALTVTLGAGSIIKFRSATLTTGTPVYRTSGSAVSVVLSSGSTLGFGAAEAGRLYVWAIDNAGAIELALSRTADIFPEGNLVSTTAEGGAGGADSASVMYSTAARTNVACRCIGYVEITTGATAGEWDNAATKIQVMGPGVKRTGDRVQSVIHTLRTTAEGTTALPFDNTIPQITEGDQYLVKAIVPTSALNLLQIEARLNCAYGSGGNAVIALFQDDTANALVAQPDNCGADVPKMLTLYYEMIAGTAASTSFQIRAGQNGGGGTFRVNKTSAVDWMGGVGYSSLTITEVFA